MQFKRKKVYVGYEDVLSERQFQNWFSWFRFSNFDLESASRSGQPIKADDDKIKGSSHKISRYR